MSVKMWNQLDGKTKRRFFNRVVSRIALSSIVFFLSARFISVAQAQNTRGSATGPTTAKGYDHPGQYLHMQDVKPADNMNPVVQHPKQDAEARQKLEAFGEKVR